MYKTIMRNKKECYFCGSRNMLECHHIFEGRNRNNSEKYGLKVWLCHFCHNEPPYGVHFNKKKNKELKIIGESFWCEQQGKTPEDFIKIFGRNYL